jgi:hypothetical protein
MDAAGALGSPFTSQRAAAVAANASLPTLIFRFRTVLSAAEFPKVFAFPVSSAKGKRGVKECEQND